MRLALLTACLLGLLVGCDPPPESPERRFDDAMPDDTLLAATPPMGWNSWDSFGVGLTEEQYKANVDFMAERLLPHGWNYAVIDILWYGGPDVTIANFKDENPDQRIDAYGRLLPAMNRWPSAADGSFKPVADYVHDQGLKFGIHIMRGIPWQAVAENTPIEGSPYRVQDIVAMEDTCVWYDGMYGVDMTKPGAQDYYDSLARLYASWGVDYIKADDMSRPYHKDEITALAEALQKVDRPIVLSLSPGAAPLAEAVHLKETAHLWRISNDFWDEWDLLYNQFSLTADWAVHSAPGHWPDADMLPLGRLRKLGPDDYLVGEFNAARAERGEPPLTIADVTDEDSRFTSEEQRTMMTLWAIFRSPLMMGGHLPETDEATLALLTNDEVLAVNQHSTSGRQVVREEPRIVWTAEDPATGDLYLALFNVGDDAADVQATWAELGLDGSYTVRDLWAGEDLGAATEAVSVTLPAHGSALYRLTPS